MASCGEDGSSSPEGPPVDSNSDHMDSEASETRGETTAMTPLSLASPVDRTVVMLRRANSDTDKFAALLMVTKLIKAEELDEDSKKMLLDAVGLPFLARMLLTQDVPEGCPPFMFKSIALSVLTCFISSCQGNPALHELIPTLTEIISNSELQENDLTLVKDAYLCLKTIVSEKSGRKAMIDFEAIGSLVDAYTTEGICWEEAMEIVMMVVSEEGSRTWEDEPEAFTKLMNHMGREFAVNQDERKFVLCNFLTYMLHSLPLPPAEVGQPEWKENLHIGLSDIILSKLGQEFRIRGLRLAGAAMESLGVPWILQIEAQAPSARKTKGRQLLLMMVHLSCIEVRMSLEDKTFEEACALASPTTACYTILEIAIIFLVNGAVDFEQKQKQQLYAALKGAFNAVLAFLKDASVDGAFLENPKNLMFVCATIRVLGAWLAEETEANKEGVYQTIPFIIKTCKHNFDHNRKISKPKKKCQSKSWCKDESKDHLPDILRFLLPGLCHLTAEDTPRTILLHLQLENLLFDYFTHHWNNIKEVFGPQAKEEECQISMEKIYTASEAMGTISNIFMNIVVQEPERVKVDVFYYSLLKFVFNKVPDIPPEECHLKLCGNLCILGLMILRHQHPNVKSTDFTIFRFVQSTVRFLWDAHNVEESQDYSSLVVSSKYEYHWGNLMDLWFLGMHTLSLLLPTIPWLSDFLLESEWPQTVVATLILVREGGMDAGLKSAFEDFLCLLARSSKPAYTTLLEKGVEQVATWLENQGLNTQESQEVARDFLQKYREAPAPPHPTDPAGLDLWRKSIWLAVLPVKYIHLLDDVFSCWKQGRLSRLVLDPEVTTMLDDLENTFTLGLITNGPSVAQWEKINESDCRKYFKSIIVSEDLGVAKPDKEIYNVACDELQVRPCECVMVGDKLETDILGGVNAGLGATVWINVKDKRVGPNDPQPDFIIPSITRLPHVLARLALPSQSRVP